MVGLSAALQDLEYHGGLSDLAWAGYDLDEPPWLGRALQQSVGVWAAPEGVCELFSMMIKFTRCNGQTARQVVRVILRDDWRVLVSEVCSGPVWRAEASR